MKITDVRTAVVQGNFEWILVRVYTDEGIVGLGEAYWGAGVKDIILRLKPILVGENPLDIDRLWNKMSRLMSGSGSIAGATVTAISGVEIALWDILGKSLKTPLYRLLGGKYRDRVRVYADCHAGETKSPQSWAKKAKEVVKKGYTAIKFDIDALAPTWTEHSRLDAYNRSLSSGEIREMVEMVEALREAVGDEVDLAIDCHWRYNTLDAIKLANGLEDYDLLWLEDPVPPENVDAFVKLKSHTKVPICTGENLYTRHGMRELIENQALDIVSPDIPKVGGLWEGRKIADLADMYYMTMAPHNVSSPISTIAAAHLCAAIPNFLILEFHAMDVPWWDDLVAGGGPIIKNGYIEVPEEPGLGVELNEDVARKHLKEGEKLF